MAGLPQRIVDMAEFSPVEDLMLAVLREAFPDVDVNTEIRADQEFPSIIVRRASGSGYWYGDERFVDLARVQIDVFCEDPNGDEDAATLAEAVRVAMRDAKKTQRVYPGIGHITDTELIIAPTRSPDWATSQGPVQYADLPSGVWRYEAEYDVEFRKPRSTTPLS